jgi:hypothetical protein
MTARRFTLVALTIAFTFGFELAPSVARAEPADPRIETLLSHGVELRRQRRDAEALEEFRQAYALQKAPRTLAQIGLAEEALGLWVEAEAALVEVLAVRGDAWIEKRRAQLQDTLKEIETHLADLEVTVSPSTAEVWINGAHAEPRAGSTTYRVISGRLLIEVRAEGYVEERRTRTIAPGAEEHERFDLARIETPAPLPPAAPQAAEQGSAAIPAPATPEEPRRFADAPQHSAPAPSTLRRTIAWSALGTAGAMGIAGVVFTVMRQQELNHYNDNSRCYFDGVARNVRCASVADDFHRDSTLMVVSYAGAAASAALSGLILLTAPQGSQPPSVGFGAGKDGVQLWFRKDL